MDLKQSKYSQQMAEGDKSSQSSYDPVKRREKHRRLYDPNERRRRHVRTYCSVCKGHHKDGKCPLAVSDEEMDSHSSANKNEEKQPSKVEKRRKRADSAPDAVMPRKKKKKDLEISSIQSNSDSEEVITDKKRKGERLDLLSEDDILKLNDPLADIRVTEADKKRICEEYDLYFSDDKLGILVCACCDRISFRKDIETFKVDRSSSMVKKMQHKLKPMRPLPKDLISYYSVFDGVNGISEFGGLLLSKKGVSFEDRSYNLCFNCSGSLNSKNNKPPKQSIANFNEIGEPPEVISNLNDGEVSLVSPCNLNIKYEVLKGGAQASLQRHVMSFENDVPEVAKALPRNIDEASDFKFKVVLCGHFTSDQEALVRSRHEVSRNRIDDAIKFLLGSENQIPNNLALSKFTRDNEALQAVPEGPQVPEDLIVRVDEGNQLASLAKAASSNIAAGEVKEDVNETSEKVTGSTFVKVNPISEGDAMKTYAVRRTSKLVKDNEDRIFSKTFIKLFPYGRRRPDRGETCQDEQEGMYSPNIIAFFSEARERSALYTHRI